MLFSPQMAQLLATTSRDRRHPPAAPARPPRSPPRLADPPPHPARGGGRAPPLAARARTAPAEPLTLLLEPVVFPPERGGRTARSRDHAAEAWGAARTWFLPRGATQGNLAACLAIGAARGPEVVVQRNVDASLVFGLIAADLTPHWLAPELDAILGVAHGVTPAALDAALAAAPRARAAIVVAPADHGALPDVAALVAVAHGHGAALVVDETWGGHLPFHPALPRHAIACGADLVITGLPGSGCALLHLGPRAENRLAAAAIDQAVGLCDSTPPGAPALAALDAARAPLVADGEQLLGATLRSAAAARAQLTGCRACACSGPELGRRARRPRLRPPAADGRPGRKRARRARRRACAARASRDRAAARHGPPAGRRARARRRRAGLAERFASALLDTLWTVAPRTGPIGSPPPCSRDRRCALRAPPGWPRTSGCPPPPRSAASPPSRSPPTRPASRRCCPASGSRPPWSRRSRAVLAAGGVVHGSADGLATFGVVAGAPRGRRRWSIG